MSNTETRLWGNTGPGPSIRCNVCGIDRMGVAAEIERLRARVAELETDISEYEQLVYDELEETKKLFDVLGLKTPEDFGDDTATEALTKKIVALKADRDSWKREALAARELLSDYGIEKKSWHGDYPAARAANGEVGG